MKPQHEICRKRGIQVTTRLKGNCILPMNNTNGELKAYPAADLFPEMPESEFQELKADIAARGQVEPIILKHNRIVDGRHRYRACIELGIEPKFVEYKGDYIIDEIISRNLHRRHLTTDERAALVVKVYGPQLSAEAAERKKAGKANLGLKSAQGRTAEKIADIAKVGRDKARQALDVQKYAPEELDGVAKGNKKMVDAVRAADRNRTATRKPRRAKRPVVLEVGSEAWRNGVIRRISQLFDKYPVTAHRQVKAIMREYVAEK
jgi:ParB-like chromosome segregation protein Spo0J